MRSKNALSFMIFAELSTLALGCGGAGSDPPQSVELPNLRPAPQASAPDEAR
jgi:hypothetical protein